MTTPLHLVPPTVKVMEVIVTERAEGKGVEEEPVRLVRYLHTLDGKLLGTLDSIDTPDCALWGLADALH